MPVDTPSRLIMAHNSLSELGAKLHTSCQEAWTFDTQCFRRFMQQAWMVEAQLQHNADTQLRCTC